MGFLEIFPDGSATDGSAITTERQREWINTLWGRLQRQSQQAEGIANGVHDGKLTGRPLPRQKPRLPKPPRILRPKPAVHRS
jgi:hypothetical protein